MAANTNSGMNDYYETLNMPDIPALESVTISYRGGTLMAMAAVLGMAGFLGWVLAVSWRWLGEFRPTIGLGMGCLIAVCLWSLYRAIGTGCYWRTDPDGITERTLLLRRRVAWPEIDRVERCDAALRGSVYRLRSGRASIEVAAGTLSYVALSASVWQHLRRVGKHHDFPLSGSALSFWDAIPDEVLGQAEISEKIPDEAIVWPIMWAMCVGLAFAVTSDASRAAWPWVGVAGSVGLATIVWLMARHMPERRYSMDSEYLRIHGKRPRMIPWSSVTRIRGASGLYTPGSVVVVQAADHRFAVAIPKGKDDSAHRAQLAWIRRRRECGDAVIVPDYLRRLAPALLEIPASVDIRPSLLFSSVLPGLLAMLLAVVILMPKARPQQPADVVFLCTIGLGAVMLAIAGRINHTRANSEGVFKRTIFGVRRVNWSEVAGYSATRWRPHSSGSSRTLKDAQGRVLLVLSTENVLSPRWDELTAIADSKLAHLLPGDGDQPSWLAVPVNCRQDQ